jgi:PAS domain S-box-containing protein
MTTTATGSDTSWLAELANALEHAVWSWDVDSGRVLLANHAFQRQFAALDGSPMHGSELLLSHVHSEDRERVRRARARRPAQGYEEEYLLVLPSGRVARVQEKALPNAGAGQVTHLLRDVSWQFDTTAQLRAEISRRTDAERDLSLTEAKYRQVVENVSEGILVTSAGKIVYANPKALALTGFDDVTAKSRPFLEFIHPEDRERVLANHQKRLRGEPAEDKYQFRVITTAGEVRWVEISGVAFDWQGAPATLNFLSDVTQRRKAEDEMREALARERELSELKSRFVAVASHEFRTPLAAILSSIELLDDYGPRLPEHERREVVGLVKAAVARMNGMVEQVLLTSRLEAGQFAFEPKPHALADLLVQVVAELEQAQAHAARISLRCEGIDEPRLADIRLVRHVLVNLLGNALKYSPTDRPVTCTLAGDGDDVRLEVADQGIGIPPEDLPRLFERFHRGTNVGNVQGTGIGLHVVRDCVQLHGGEIAVDSTPGKGTTFRVRLRAPIAPAAS